MKHKKWDTLCSDNKEVLTGGLYEKQQIKKCKNENAEFLYQT